MSNVSGLPVPEPEAYVTEAEMARLLGVSSRTLRTWRSNGEVPYETWGARMVRYQPSRTIAAARARGR
jgi:hypothetical protein